MPKQFGQSKGGVKSENNAGKDKNQPVAIGGGQRLVRLIRGIDCFDTNGLEF